MPLLRLASLIFASLLLAALSALAPSPAQPAFSVAHQAPVRTIPTALAQVSPAGSAHGLGGTAFSALRQHGPELDRAAGQSIPETGQ